MVTLIKRLITAFPPIESVVSVPRQKPRLARIADSLGVSTATVSNALSGKGRVSPELAERIRSTAAELGYVPSVAGRALRTGRSGVLGLVLPDIGNPLFPKIAQAIENAAAKVGYGVLIADSRGEIAAQTQAIERLVERGVDGMIVVPRRGTRIVRVGCPVAVIDSPSTPGNTVSADHWAGGMALGAHLAALGHRHVVLIGNSLSSNVQSDRLGGLKVGLAGAVTETIWLEKLEADGGKGCLLGLEAAVARGVTAVAAVSDLTALRALTELQRAGIAVPEAVSVTGFDDLVWSSVVTPGLTTMRMDEAAIAEIAVAALLSAIEAPMTDQPTLADDPALAGDHGSNAGDTVTATQSRVPMQIVLRQSSGPARDASQDLHSFADPHNPNPRTATKKLTRGELIR